MNLFIGGLELIQLVNDTDFAVLMVVKNVISDRAIIPFITTVITVRAVEFPQVRHVSDENMASLMVAGIQCPSFAQTAEYLPQSFWFCSRRLHKTDFVQSLKLFLFKKQLLLDKFLL